MKKALAKPKPRMSVGGRSLKLLSSAMGSSVVSRYIAFSLLCLCVLSAESVGEESPSSFSFDQFEKGSGFGSQIALYGDADVRDSAVSLFGKGGMMFKRPMRFFGTNPGFSTNFSFSISAGNGGSLAFLMVPNNKSLISANGDEIGASPRFLAVKFGSDIAIDVGGEISVKSSNLSDVGLALSSNQKLQSWIDYDGASKIIEVRVSKFNDSRPEKPLVSCPVDFSNALWREALYVGMSSSSGNYTQTNNIYSWNFEVKHGAPYLMHSEPLDPEYVSVRAHEEPLVHARKSSSWKIIVASLVGAVCGAFVASAVFLLRSKVVKRYPIAPIEYPVLVGESMESGHEKIVLDGSKVVNNAAK